MINRGSEWGRWDLHVHTKGTAKNDQFGNICFDEYCVELFQKAINNNVLAIGITDYFSIENYKKVSDFQKKISANANFNTAEKEQISKILVIPNVELRLTPSTNKGSAINFHFLLDPNRIDEYENRFTDYLVFKVSSSESYKLNSYDLIKLGRKVDKNPSLDEEIAVKKGISAFVLNPSDIINAFNKYPSFKDHCITVVSNSNVDGASSFQGHEKFLLQQEGSTLEVLRESIYKSSDAIFSAIDTDFFLGKKATNQESHLQLFGTYKPCIHGSDAHSLDKLFNPNQNRFCWIKAEPTFEGLKQILHEPETRVHIGSTRPELKNDYEVIDHIELNNHSVFNEVIYFNQNLTSIIGGRSSGKSTLLQCLAKKLGNNTISGNKPNDSTHLDELCKDLKVVWKDGREDDSRRIEYFYQGHMYEKSRDEGIEDIVENLLKQQKADLFESFHEKWANTKSQISIELSQHFSKLEQIQEKKEALKTIGNIADIQNQIEILTETINTNKTEQVSELELQNHDKQKQQVIDLEQKIEQTNQLKIQINSINYQNFIHVNNPLTHSSAYSFIQKDVEQYLESIKHFADIKIQEMLKTATSQLEVHNTNILKQRHDIKSNEEFKKVSEFLAKSENLKPILDQKQQEELKVKQINNVQKEIDSLESDAKNLMQTARTAWLSIFEAYNDVIREVNTFNLSDDLQIVASIIFDEPSYQNWMRKCINQQGEKAQNFTNTTVSSETELLTLFDELIQNIQTQTIRFRTGSSFETFTKEFFDKTWFKLKYDVTYDNDNYNVMSQGKKAFVVLKMTLDCSESKCPIIIDQPEDDLDNRAIYTELVTYLKRKKSQRQIILVTHNANVVVNADSELVIVANQHGSHNPNDDQKKFQYKYGSIECLTKSTKNNASTLNSKRIKDHICEILEGGDKAFRLREKKYNFR